MKVKLFAVIILVSLIIPHAWAHEGTVFIKQLMKDNDYQPLLEGGKDSVKMEAGKIVKLRGQKGSPHSTKDYEEILIILKGRGLVTIEGKDYPVKAGEILYIPPHQNHHVTNNGSRKFEYIYVASPAIKGVVENDIFSKIVIPAKAGIQCFQ